MAVTGSFDAEVYDEGDVMSLTVNTDPGDRDRFTETPFTVNVSVPGVGNADVTAKLRKQVEDAAVIVTDPERTWAKQSDDGDEAVFTATA